MQKSYGYLKSPENKKKWIVDAYAADVVRDIFRMCLEGKGQETIARILQERKILIPMAYWYSLGLKRGGKRVQPNPYKWSKSSIAKILANQEYWVSLIFRIPVITTPPTPAKVWPLSMSPRAHKK